MKQYEAVIKIMEANGGFATLKYLNDNVFNVHGVEWKTKTPFASIRRIVQDSRFFFKIKPGLWALKAYKDKLPKGILKMFSESKEPTGEERKYTHYYYQGILAEIGVLRNYKVYIPAQDKNKPFLNKKLEDTITLKELPLFTYDYIINAIKSIDVVWINERNFPITVFEVENSTDFKNSLSKFYELIDFHTAMFIVSDEVRRPHLNSVLNLSIYQNLKNRIKFCNYESLENHYSNPFQFKLSMD